MDRLLSDSDWENYSQSSGSEDQEDIEFLYDGKAQSILSSLDESIERIDDFLSFERGFTYGDTVCSVADPSGQMGRVVSVDMLVDLESINGVLIKDVNTKKLSKICSISVGDYVISGPWLGRVTKVVDCVSILFDDGVKCEVTATDLEKIIPISPYLLEDSQYPYYPGQRVKVRFSAASESNTWLCSTWKANQKEGTVCGVKPGQLHVDWIASAPAGHNSKSPAPPQLQDSENLSLLSCFSHASWQLGDWCVLPVTERKEVCANTTSHESFKNTKILKGVTGALNTNFDEVYVIVKTKTKVDVLWQDGNQSLGLESSSLLPKDVFNTHEFWSGQFVMEKGTFHEQDISGKRKWGFVKAVDAKEQTVKVKWKSFSIEGHKSTDQDWIEETVSAYELIEHPDYSYSFGDAVFRLTGSQPINHPCKENRNAEVAGSETMLCDKNCNKEPENCYSVCIGTVIGFEDGAVEVKWAMGSITKVAPSEIFRLDKYEVLNESAVVCEENIEQLNQDMIDQDRHSSDQKGKGLSDALCDDGCSKTCSSESSLSLPKSVIGYVSTVIGNLFGSFGSTLLPRAISTSHICEDDTFEAEEGICEFCTDEQLMIIDEFQPVKTPELEAKAIHGSKDATFSAFGKQTDVFSQFDMVSGCSDHHFLDGAGKDYALTQVNRQWLRKVRHEWSILEKNLPETIYVRVYEERMDLMRAVIVGAPGTPYHDGLFFFDIYLPPEYPQVPPLVHYHSGGLHVNPNLYECGKVCLSLLNTWTGTGTEVWSPGSSTILQVLLSLQALVLNEKPYFNEAGYDSQIGKAEGEKNSVSYNENAFLVTCKSMIYLLRKPPKHFEALVEEHFRSHSEQILLACKAYMEGAPIGYAFRNNESENRKGTSTGFKIMLAKIFPMLVEAFADKGIDCSEFKP